MKRRIFSRRPQAGAAARRRDAAWISVVAIGLYGVVAWQLGVHLSPLALALDAAILASLLLALRGGLRGRWPMLICGLALGAVLQLGHSVKFAYLGAPIHPGDGAAGLALFQVMPVQQRAISVAVVLVLLAALLLPLRADWRGVAALLRGAIVVALLLWLALPLQQRLERIVPAPHGDDAARLLAQGGALPFLVKWRDWWTDEREAPGAAEVLAALERLPVIPGPGPAAGPRRNLHLIVVESLWDPLQLQPYAFSRDPFDPRLRAAWERAGRGHALVPVFGGATANAEFEALCGLPAHVTEVVFATRLTNNVPCLPRVLREAGYLTTASHPYRSDFWNREEAYSRVGFERYFPLRAFEIDDVDGAFLADGSLFRQLRQRQVDEPAQPHFEYVMTLSSHFPFDRDREKRPDLVRVRPKAAVLQDYANAIAYTTTALMDHVEAVRAADPDALVAIVGDHAPVLGLDPDPYQVAGVSLHVKEQAEASVLALARTPLLLIDGRAGELATGDIALRELPALLLERLGVDVPSLPQFARVGEAARRWDAHRILGRSLVRGEAGWRTCRRDDEGCRSALAVLDALRLLRRDLAVGHQHALALLGGSRMDAAPAMSIEGGFAPCMLDVSEWGPRWMRVGEPFNQLPDGRSGLWMRSGGQRGMPRLHLGEVDVSITFAAGVAAAAFEASQLPEAPGLVPLWWECGDGNRGEIGDLVVLGPDDPEPAPGEVPPAPGCEAGVVDFGPRTIEAGKPFNPQPDGRSAFWATLQRGARGFSVWMDGRELEFVLGGTQLAVMVDEPPRLPTGTSRGIAAVELRCGDTVVATLRSQVSPAAPR